MQVGLNVRGLYGEHSEVMGNLFQISNQTTLGRSERDSIESLERVTRQIIETEERARERLSAHFADIDVTRARVALDKALNRKRVAERAKQKPTEMV